MFDELKLPPEKPTWMGARILAMGVAGMLVSMGLCSLMRYPISMAAIAAFILFLLSALAALVGVISILTNVIREIRYRVRTGRDE